MPVMLEDDGGEQGRLEAVRAAMAHDALKAAQRRSPVRFLVVGQRVQVALDLRRCPELPDQPALLVG